MYASTGRRTGPYALSGTLALVPAASTISTLRSNRLVSGPLGRRGGGGRRAVAFAALSFFAVLSFFVVSRAGCRGPGLASVAESEKTRALDASTRHAARRESPNAISYAAGRPIFVVSSPAIRLFQPIQAALWNWVLPRDRNGTRASFQVASESPTKRIPGTLPVVTSTSSSKSAAALNVLSSNRVVYIVLGNHPPATRW